MNAITFLIVHRSKQHHFVKYRLQHKVQFQIFRKKNVTKEIVNATAKDTKNRPATNFNISVVHFEESHNLSPSQKVFISKWFSKFLDIHPDLEQS